MELQSCEVRSSERYPAHGPPVVVVGAGVVGASVAYHLARAGVPVTVLDRGSAPGRGVTGGSFGWIGDAGGEWPGGAADLRGFVLADWRRLAGEVPGAGVRWCGSLTWSAVAPGPWVGRAEIAALEPGLRAVPPSAVWSPGDGAVEPAEATRALVAAAQDLQARVRLGITVTAVSAGGVETSAGFVRASAVVLAAGTEVTALCGVPVAVSPALLIRVAAPPGLIGRILATPAFEVRPAAGGLVLTAPLGESPAAVVERLRATLRAGASLRLLGWQVGERPVPAGGPVVGWAGPAYVAVMHSAVTLAPTVGRLVAQELVSGRPAPELSGCRVSDSPATG